MKPTDDRHWILNPAGHRLNAELGMVGRDGEEIDHPVFGKAELIVGPPNLDEGWVCDLCSLPILTRYGDEPFPVPMLGSYALCLEHFNEAQTWPYEDSAGTQYPYPMGEWPANLCACSACAFTAGDWFPQLKEAYT
jgi:hypothetical protein